MRTISEAGFLKHMRSGGPKMPRNEYRCVFFEPNPDPRREGLRYECRVLADRKRDVVRLFRSFPLRLCKVERARGGG
jgi:hypothetical protein